MMYEDEIMQSQLAAEVGKDEALKSMEENNANPSRRFDPSRMIEMIRRKALIKELAAAYHGECVACCQVLLDLQKNTEEPVFDFGTPAVMVNERKERPMPPKRSKKIR